tara:strand:- start:3310 stop:3855 length:546 start_codon:yes stop_codon:yes gene_type:complete
MSLFQKKTEEENLDKDNFDYWDEFTSRSQKFLTARQITLTIVIIGLFVQFIGLMMTPTDWLIWQVLTFITATNLGAVVLAIHAQKSADEIRSLYQEGFNADLYHTLHIMSRFKNKFVSELEKQGNDLEEELDELTPNLYSFFKGYLEVFNEQYKKEEGEIVKRTYEDVDISELFNEEHDNV